MLQATIAAADLVRPSITVVPSNPSLVSAMRCSTAHVAPSSGQTQGDTLNTVTCATGVSGFVPSVACTGAIGSLRHCLAVTVLVIGCTTLAIRALLPAACSSYMGNGSPCAWPPLGRRFRPDATNASRFAR
jgi:hypothetical protein